MTQLKHQWTFLFRAPRGHQFFREENTGLIAIADDSGATPDQTEDGILYLDDERPIQVGPNGFLVPITYRARRHVTPAAAAEVKLICEHFGFSLSIDGLEFVPKNATMTRQRELKG